MATKLKRGGRREGAGRKPKGDAPRTVPIPVKVSPSELDTIRARAIEHELTLADYVRGALGLNNLGESST